MFGFQPHLWGFQWALALDVAEGDARSRLKRAGPFIAARRPRRERLGYGKGFFSSLLDDFDRQIQYLALTIRPRHRNLRRYF